VEKSAGWAYHEGRFHDSFQRLARVISSKFIVAHVRLRTSGPIDECHAHPFILEYLGRQWIFAHNGRAPAVESYRGKKFHVTDAVSDSARAFEYLLDGIARRSENARGIIPLFSAVARTSQELVEEYPGNYNFVLTNGWVLFAFSNHRQFMLLKESSSLERGLLLTTVQQGLSAESWVRFAKRNGSAGLLMAILGSDVFLLEDI
jgi:predicted glutamine amidotransferase